MSTSFSQVYNNQNNTNYLKTVQLYPKGSILAMPIINLNGNEVLEFHFDDLNNSSASYYYTIIQCRADWTPSNMSQIEYIDGFTESTLYNYDYSYSTKTNYIHYSLEIPNMDMNITKSGNYVLIVYTETMDEPLLVKRFMVVEPKVTIDAGIAYTSNIYNRSRYQEVVFDINTKGMIINNPNLEIKATVLQNYRWDNAYIGIPPYLVGYNSISYQYNNKIVFPSGNEFRQVDIRSTRFKGQNVRAFDLSNEDYNQVYLHYDFPRNNQPYLQYNDLSGQYYVESYDFPNPYLEADYVWTRFNYDASMPLDKSSNLYIVGNFNNWQCDNNSMMVYQEDENAYVKNILLKQGFYNYEYLIKNSNGTTDNSITEGFNAETSNDYTILIYYTPFGARYDRLIAVEHLNTLLNRY
ncbi:MAG: DUF5103 domain-containing protein [Chitinophagales bacterium]|nr:DUF5103 domain-containing protein [Chitinophagales bacterium]